MEFNIFSIIICLILVGWIFSSVKLLLSIKQFDWTTLTKVLATVCLAVGVIGFMGPSLISTTHFGVSTSFEWPIGHSDSALKYPNGDMVVAHEPTGRVQVYNESLQFQRGWSVNGNGGVFELFPVDESSFYIYTARNNMKYHYNLNGQLISSQTYSGNLPQKSKHLVSVSIPTAIYLEIFTHPFKSWFIAAIGMFLLFITDKFEKPRSKK